MPMNALELKIQPLVLVLAFAAAMKVATKLTPAISYDIPWRAPIFIACSGTGAVLGIAGILAFWKARTTIHPERPGSASAVVASGVYRLSRNPMYLGLLLFLIGWAFHLGNPLAFLFLPVFVAYMNRFQIIPEERFLMEKFGARYAAYKQAVRRWL
jgi:protein-S-isoprenylcysteine O-methyltransferase Ste14